MSLWGKNDNKLSDGTVSVNHANKTVIGSGTTFGGGVGYAATGDIIRFGQPFGGSTGYLGEAVITGIGNTQELFIDSTAGMSPVDITGSNYQITQSPKSSVTDSAFNKFSRGVAQAGSERLSTTLNGNVAVGGTVITTTATATGNNIVVGDNVEITHGDVFPRVQRGKVHSIATNTVRLQSALKETKSEYLIPTVINHLINNNLEKVKVLNSSESWFGVTYQEDKRIVKKKIQKLIADGVYPSSLS